MKAFRFTDNLDIVDDTPIRVKATIHLVPEAEGGRHGPFTKGYRPNHNFQGPDDRFFFIGQIEAGENEWGAPGESKVLWITFLNARGLRELLVPGRVWRIQEGGKLVGTGTVIEVR